MSGMRTILQTESAECGLACIAMVHSHFGQEVDFLEYRRRFPVSARGTTLQRLVEIAECVGLTTRAVRAELEDVSNLQLPCIVHWDMNHFVVLERASAKLVTIRDPAVGVRKLSMRQFSDHFTGVALELAPGIDFRPEVRPSALSIRKLTGAITGLRRGILQLVILSLALQVFSLLPPFLTQGLIDQVANSSDLSILALIASALILLLLMQVCFTYLRSWSSLYLSTQLDLRWMTNVVAHLVRLPLAYFERRHLGDVASRVGSVTAIQGVLTGSAVTAVLDGVMVIATVIVMVNYSFLLMIPSVSALVAYMLLRAATYNQFRQLNDEQIALAAAQQSHLLETIRGIQAIKLSVSESGRVGRWLQMATTTQNQTIKISKASMAYAAGNGLIFGLERIAVLYLALRLVLDGTFTIGMMVAYLAYREQFTTRVSSLVDTALSFKMLEIHAQRLGDIVLTEPETSLGSAVQLQRQTEATLIAESVSFRFSPADPWVIKDCSLRVEPGEMIAIVGRSGAGKSTLLKVLLGLLEPSEGSIQFGGVSISRLGSSGYRSCVGAVTQDDTLFAGSIADNIALGEDSVDKLRMEEAARCACVHDDIQAMPMGYSTIVGDLGSSLSGGQRQRIMIARALYRQPQILFLDEATSHLDTANERVVAEGIRALGISRIVVSHRSETLRGASRVFEIQEGRLVEIELHSHQVVEA